MPSPRLRSLAALTILSILSASIGLAADAAAPPATPFSEAQRATLLAKNVTQGALRVVQPDGGLVECPLRHTDVRARVSGFIARVTVVQTFYNPTSEPIEAVYVFPLPHEAAVDAMTMLVGDRRIVGLIERRAAARQIYEEALAAGQTAALLEQERPNIFTQSVGNIEPGRDVKIEISYVDVLRYDLGTYEFHFPMVVGPRFIPGGAAAPPASNPPELASKVSPPVPNTDRVPDAARISPPVLKPGFRNGHDISLAVTLDAGVPIQNLEVVNHQAEVKREGDRCAAVKLDPADSIPNKDFVLRYHVVGKKPEMAVLAHTGDAMDARRLGHGYFMLMVQPKEDERLTKSPPRELVFLLDVSGSMSGAPTAKVQDAMREMLKLCRPIDTLQVITFANQTQQLFEKPVPVNAENIGRAVNFTQGLAGSGGTHMLQGVQRAIDQPLDRERVRIVIMLTDGYIGNEAEIIEHVGKHCGDQVRFWAIGIGSSPNMFLVDGVARQGGGMGKRLALEDESAGLAEEVITRIQRAQLAKVQIDWGDLEVAETYPAKIPELWAGRPIVLFGRYARGGHAEIKLTGQIEGEPATWPLTVNLPDDEDAHDVLAKVWARRKIEDLMQQTYYQGSPAVEEEVTAIALDYRLMSQYTSFVAVDAKDADELAKRPPAQPPRRMLVPVPLPEGTRWEGFFGPLGESEEAIDELAVLPMLGKAAIAADAPMGGAVASRRAFFGRNRASEAARGLHPSRPASASMPAQLPAHFGLMLGEQKQAQTAGSAGAHWYFRGGEVAQNGRAAGLAGAYQVFGRRIERESLRDLETADFDGSILAESLVQVERVPAEIEKLTATARDLLTAAEKLAESHDFAAAERALARAYFLAAASGDPALSAEALAALESQHSQRIAADVKRVPALAAKLDFVLRDVSLDEAIDQLARAAGLKIQLADGAAADTQAALAGREPRTTYLDLRGATVAQALEWLLRPLRLDWVAPAQAADPIRVASLRLLPGESPWVYDVSLIALPSAKELTGDDAAKLAAIQADAKEFIAAVRAALGADEKAVTWFGAVELLVIDTPERHAQAATLFSTLATPGAKAPDDLAALWTKTSRRAAERRPQLDKLRQAEELMAAAAAHDSFSWQLHAAALNGQLDLEALTELQIAWRSASTRKLLEGAAAGIALRSAWALAAAARLLPAEHELVDLSTKAIDQSQPARRRAVESLSKNAQDPSALLAAVYAALAAPGDQLAAQVLAALPADAPAESTLACALRAARVLLDDEPTLAADQLAALLTAARTADDDGVVLAALACRRAGRESWSAFRAQRDEILASQLRSGDLIVLINRLPGAVTP